MTPYSFCFFVFFVKRGDEEIWVLLPASRICLMTFVDLRSAWGPSIQTFGLFQDICWGWLDLAFVGKRLRDSMASLLENLKDSQGPS